MKCIKCNNEINTSQRFCKFCGTPISESLKANNNNQNQNNNKVENDKSNNGFANMPDTGVINTNINTKSQNQSFDLNNKNSTGNNLNLNKGNNLDNTIAYNNENTIAYSNLDVGANVNVNGSTNVSGMPNMNSNFNMQNTNNIPNPNNNQNMNNYSNMNNNFNNPYINQGQVNGNVYSGFNNKNNTAKNKRLGIIIGSCIGAAILLIIVGGILYNALSGKALSEDKIRESLVGEEVYLLGNDVEISDNNMKKVEVLDRKTKKKSSDQVKVEITLENGDTTFVFDATAQYYYFKDEGWKLSGAIQDNVKDIKTDKDFNKLIKENIQEDETIYSDTTRLNTSSLTEVTGAQLQVNENSYSYKVNATAEFSNGVYAASGDIEASIDYEWDNDTWEIVYSKLSLNGNTTKNDSVDEEQLKKSLESYLSSRYVSYEKKYVIGTREVSANTSVTGDFVTSLNINKYVMNDSSNLIVAEVTGTISEGIIKNVEFQGNVSVPLNITKDADSDAKLNIVSGTVEGPSEEDVQSLLIDKRFDGNKIDITTASSFKETKRNEDGVMNKILHGTLTVNGQPVEVQVEMTLTSDYNGNIQWKVYDIDKKGSYSYIEF
ncbi:MAG: zinc ribbon domain-containing protein [Clostridiales bacterium]|nr:zinc ribbon domain-containing protein [Clostridiales bacterium]